MLHGADQSLRGEAIIMCIIDYVRKGTREAYTDPARPTGVSMDTVVPESQTPPWMPSICYFDPGTRTYYINNSSVCWAVWH